MVEKCAIIDVTIELLPDISQIIDDGGLKILCSLDSPHNGCYGTIRFIITGDALPDFCATEKGKKYPHVGFKIQTERYGRQRLNRIVEIYPMAADSEVTI
ncbi:hypothetical protein QM467_04780 [Rhodoblastus sp. 17X3]|uniref:hypothetical protein n=1 Tax=Rhodoblastus sp. 17X3 TaxID=3047026 RepID=UPI0024B73BFB|nr:hypothetical protein [Rhodoblastus sp. 17X3]MDI9847375.1 hypothetical protein [Rhodoblastus sp. 17X3]